MSWFIFDFGWFCRRIFIGVGNLSFSSFGFVGRSLHGKLGYINRLGGNLATEFFYYQVLEDI